MRGLKRRRSGVSIIEIMMCFSIITVVIIAFGAVFPSGYRLNFSNMQHNKASSLASSVAQELRNANPTILDALIAANGNRDLTAANVLAYNVANPTNPLFRTQIDIKTRGAEHFKFYIPSDNGIVIHREVNTNTLTSDKVCNYEIQVTVCWEESRRGKVQQKSVSLMTVLTDGVKGRYSE